MQQFQDLPLPITAGAGAAIVLVLVLAIVLVRRSRTAGDPARATAAKPPKKARPPKPPKKVKMSRGERRHARRAMKHGSVDDPMDAAAVASAVATPEASSAIAEDRPVSPADPGVVSVPSVGAEEPVAATSGDSATESIWEPPVMTEDEDAAAQLTAPIAMREALAKAQSPAAVSAVHESEWAIPIEDDPEYDPASTWMTADSNDVRWTDGTSDAPLRGRAGDIPTGPGRPDEWPTGSWESIEKLLPEAPQAATGWDDRRDPDGSADAPTVPEVPEIAVPGADGLDWSALGTVDADLPHDEWVADALAREATVDADRAEPPVGALAGDATPGSPWQPIDETIDVPPRSDPAHPDGPSARPATTPSPQDDVTSPSPITPESATRASSDEIGDAATAPPAGTGVSAVPVGSVGGTPVLIDVGALAGLGGSMELVIEPNDDGNGLRLHLAERGADGDGTPPPAPAAGIAPAPEIASQARESVPQPPAAADLATTRPLDADPLPAAIDDPPAAPTTSPRPTTTVNGWWNASAPASGADRVTASASETTMGDPDPARILADIRARLAALDARRNGDVPPV